MPTEIVNALIAAIVALLTAGLSGYVTWNQIQRERRKWLIDLKTAYSVELYKTRLAEYPKVLHILQKLSSRAPAPRTPEIAQEVGREINDWFYSTGGLCADATTRGALLGLRNACLHWKNGTKPDEIRVWRNAAIFSLRRDLDIKGLEDFNPDDTTPLLEKLKKEMDAVSK
jgi:hypothetical protein